MTLSKAGGGRGGFVRYDDKNNVGLDDSMVFLGVNNNLMVCPELLKKERGCQGEVECRR